MFKKSCDISTMLRRFHAVRVCFGSAIFILSVIILYQNFYNTNNYSPGVIQLPQGMIEETWMTLEEFSALTRVNSTCPVCYGREACEEIIRGISKGSLGISRIPFNDHRSPGKPTIHQVYKVKTGKVKLWLQPIKDSHAMLERFEEYVCRNASIDKKKVKKCNTQSAAKSSFLYTSTLDLNTFLGLYRGHLVSPRRIPMTICPTYKLVRGLVEAFDEDQDLTLTAEEKAILLTSVATNPDIAIHRFVINQKLQFPVLPFFGSCGRVSFIQGPHKPLAKFIDESLPVRLDFANQILQLVDSFIHDDPSWLMFTTDISFDNLVVTQDENQVFFLDLSNAMLLDKDIVESGDSSSEKKSGSKSEECDQNCFDSFYHKLTERKDDHAQTANDSDPYLTDTFTQCGKLSSMAGHMYGLVCQMVLSDRPEDIEQRGEHKSHDGLLHSLDTEGTGLKMDTKRLERLLAQCSGHKMISGRTEAAMEIIELISGSWKDGEDNVNEDFNDNNIKFNENEDFHAKYEDDVGKGDKTNVEIP